MNSKDMVLEYYNHYNIKSKSLRDRILDLNALFAYLNTKGLLKKDIDEDLMRFIIKQIVLPIADEYKLLKLESYLAYYVMDSFKKIFGSSTIEIEKEPEYEVEENYETIDVKPEDIPEKQYDLEFLKLIGVEDPEWALI